MMNERERIDIRRIRHEERDGLLSLYRHLHADDAPATDEDVERQWSAMLDDPRMHCLVAALDGELVGTCTLVLVPNLTRGARPYGLIENVVVHRAYRQRGIGSRLLDTALGIAWEHRCYKAMLLTGSRQDATLRFYEQAGFQPGIKTGFIAYPPAPADLTCRARACDTAPSCPP